jgi:hypothetical protein
MAFAAVSGGPETRLQTLGNEKVQHFTWTCLASDTTGTLTANFPSQMSRVELQGGIGLTAATTYAGNAATLTFTNNTPVTYTCSCASASATAGGVYADTSGNLFSVAGTIAGATTITLNGFKPPASATITKTGAIAGDATIGTLAVTTAPTLYGTAVAYGF